MRGRLAQRRVLAFAVVVERSDAEIVRRSGAQVAEGPFGPIARNSYDVQDDATKVVQFLPSVVHVQPVSVDRRAVTIGPGPGQLYLV